MKKNIVQILVLTLLITLAAGNFMTGNAERTDTYKKIDIDVNKEDKDVGLKRLEMLDRVLDQDLMDRKRAMVRNIESDYNIKTKKIIDSIIQPLFDNRVFTHIDVNFFSPDFEAEVRASQKVAVSIILRKDGFQTWVDQNLSEADAMRALKELIGNTLNVPVENISVLTVK